MLFRRVVQTIIQYFQKKSGNEYEEEMRREDMLEAVKRLIPFIILAMFALLCVVGGYSYWDYRKDQELFRSELLYDEYVKNIHQGSFEDAKKKRAQLKNARGMKALLEIEDCARLASKFYKTRKEEKKKMWSAVYSAYENLDNNLHSKSRSQSSMYHFTRFVLAILASEIPLKDSRIDVVKHYTQAPNSFMGVGYAMQAIYQIQKKSVDKNFRKLLNQWEQYTQSWIPSACAIGAESFCSFPSESDSEPN
ncbi:hypothetical protein [Holospora undulata]|uniref:Uncharacterized protein n=1 Tax=Holospora undulata HU1 TaxID=1321371 RepID=A0A061JHE6_9PROT|nr:hypothetical protein [Holospora undulata]ETZ04708.1 hypothetical protein K737_300866 [Holospora undulata HU1]